jgi:hypothetical protein
MNRMSNSISRPNIAAPGEAFNNVWWVEQMAHAASAKKMPMSLALTNSAMSSLAVRSMFVNTVNMLQYSIRLWILNAVRLTLYAKCLA